MVINIYKNDLSVQEKRDKWHTVWLSCSACLSAVRNTHTYTKSIITLWWGQGSRWEKTLHQATTLTSVQVRKITTHTLITASLYSLKYPIQHLAPLAVLWPDCNLFLPTPTHTPHHVIEMFLFAVSTSLLWSLSSCWITRPLLWWAFITVSSLYLETFIGEKDSAVCCSHAGPLMHFSPDWASAVYLQIKRGYLLSCSTQKAPFRYTWIAFCL